MGRLVINGEEIYELDEQCLREKNEKQIRRDRTSEIKNQKEDALYLQKQKRQYP